MAAPDGRVYAIHEFANLIPPANARFEIGKPLTARLAVPLSNGCVGDPVARALVDEAARTITFEASVRRVLPADWFCTQAVSYQLVDVSFTVAHIGTYSLKGKIWPTLSSGVGSYDHIQPPIGAHSYDAGPIDVVFPVVITE